MDRLRPQCFAIREAQRCAGPEFLDSFCPGPFRKGTVRLIRSKKEGPSAQNHSRSFQPGESERPRFRQQMLFSVQAMRHAGKSRSRAGKWSAERLSPPLKAPKQLRVRARPTGGSSDHDGGDAFHRSASKVASQVLPAFSAGFRVRSACRFRMKRWPPGFHPRGKTKPGLLPAVGRSGAVGLPPEARQGRSPEADRERRRVGATGSWSRKDYGYWLPTEVTMDS